MMAMLMAVVRALKSRASTAAGEVISCHAELLTVQIRRLKIGRAMNPARRASAATPKPEVNFSLVNPRHRRRRSCLNLLARSRSSALCFFFHDTATTEISTLSLHDAHFRAAHRAIADGV